MISEPFWLCQLNWLDLLSPTLFPLALAVLSHMLLAVQEKCPFSFQVHHDTCKAALQGTRARDGKLLTNESILSKFLSSLPPPAEGHPSLARAIGRASDTGMWLSTISRWNSIAIHESTT
jgi:hypothetical protein